MIETKKDLLICLQEVQTYLSKNTFYATFIKIGIATGCCSAIYLLGKSVGELIFSITG